MVVKCVVMKGIHVESMPSSIQYCKTIPYSFMLQSDSGMGTDSPVPCTHEYDMFPQTTGNWKT